MSPRESLARLTRWLPTLTPRKGWTHEHVEDLEEPAHTCEACGTTDIRYVHSLTHSEYSGELLVGCICAEHLCADYVNPKERERLARKRAAVRALPVLDGSFARGSSEGPRVWVKGQAPKVGQLVRARARSDAEYLLVVTCIVKRMRKRGLFLAGCEFARQQAMRGWQRALVREVAR